MVISYKTTFHLGWYVFRGALSNFQSVAGFLNQTVSPPLDALKFAMRSLRIFVSSAGLTLAADLRESNPPSVAT